MQTDMEGLDDRIPPWNLRPRKFVLTLCAILASTNLFYCLSVFLTDLAPSLALKLYLGYATILLLMCGTTFWITRLRFIAAIFVFLLGVNIIQQCVLAYLSSYSLSRENTIWTYVSVGACCLAVALSVLTLRTEKSQVYKIYSSLEWLTDLGFIDPKRNRFVWSHSLMAYPTLGPYPRELPRLGKEGGSKYSGLSGLFVAISGYANFISALLVGLLSSSALLGAQVFALFLISMLLGHGFWKMVLIARINGKYRKRYGADLILQE
jgi:hypothetical protein